MLLLSLNIRGIGGTLKSASFHRLMDQTKTKIVFLQETLVSAQKARAFFYGFQPSWAICSVNSVRTSGGILVSWDPSLFELTPFISAGDILLTGSNILIKREITLLNVYGPCTARKSFWNEVKDSGILSANNLIMAGDFNIILDSEEAWGATNTGFIDDFFKDLFSSKNIIDIKPSKLTPTWRNGRLGQHVISRRLDRVMISEDLLSDIVFYRTWVAYPFISDHAPICIQLDFSAEFKEFPFKFNDHWIKDKEFLDIVNKVRKYPIFQSKSSSQKKVIWKLQVLKNCTKEWYKKKLKNQRERLVLLESDFKQQILFQTREPNNPVLAATMRSLEVERNDILRQEEDKWRLCSRAVVG